MDTEQQLLYNSFTALYSGMYIRRGQRLTIPNRSVEKLGFWLDKFGSPTGNVTYTIRKVSNDSIIASKVWGNASLLSFSTTYYEVTFDSAVTINEEVRICVEFSGGDSHNFVWMAYQSTDVKVGEFRTGYNAPIWVDTTGDIAYIYTYSSPPIPPVVPSGTTEAATLVGDVDAILNGEVTDDGGEDCLVRFQYGTTVAYGTNTAWQTGKVTDDIFSQRITGLTPLTGYHFRAQIKNSAGTANGADKTFTTTSLPTPFLRRVLRDTFGGGSDISAANPLQVYDPAVFNSLVVYEGTATADGPDTSTITDTVLATKPDFNGQLVVITSGDYKGQTRDIDQVTNAGGGKVHVATAFDGTIVEDVTYVILSIRPTTAEVAAIEAKLDNGTTGLAALKALVDSKARGRLQIAATTINLNQAAGSKHLFTGFLQDVVLEKLVLRMPNVDISGGGLTSISIQTDDAEPQIFVSPATGALVNLTPEAQVSWTGACLIKEWTEIQLTIAGAATGIACSCDVVAACRAVVAGGYLV